MGTQSIDCSHIGNIIKTTFPKQIIYKIKRGHFNRRFLKKITFLALKWKINLSKKVVFFSLQILPIIFSLGFSWIFGCAVIPNCNSILGGLGSSHVSHWSTPLSATYVALSQSYSRCKGLTRCY